MNLVYFDPYPNKKLEEYIDKYSQLLTSMVRLLLLQLLLLQLLLLQHVPIKRSTLQRRRLAACFLQGRRRCRKCRSFLLMGTARCNVIA